MAQKVRILVVEDEAAIRSGLVDVFVYHGYEVETAASLAEALAIFEKRPPSLLITDVNMPGGNGFELLHAVRKRFRDTVVVMLTAYGTIRLTRALVRARAPVPQ